MLTLNGDRTRSIETGHAGPGMGVEQPTRHMHLENPAAQTFELELELAEYYRNSHGGGMP